MVIKLKKIVHDFALTARGTEVLHFMGVKKVSPKIELFSLNGIVWSRPLFFTTNPGLFTRAQMSGSKYSSNKHPPKKMW